MAHLLPAQLSALLHLRREGQIRLPLEEEALLSTTIVGEKDERLPFFITGEEAEAEGYTSAHLLLECVCASLWNAACLGYLLLRSSPPPSSSSSSLSAPAEEPAPHFVLALLALVAIPLCIGTSAGAACVFSRSEIERELRARRGWAKSAAVWGGMVGCIAALWPILAYVVAGQPTWLQVHLGVTLAIVQGLLVKAGTDSSPSSAEEEGAIFLPRGSLDDEMGEMSEKDAYEYRLILPTAGAVLEGDAVELCAGEVEQVVVVAEK